LKVILKLLICYDKALEINPKNVDEKGRYNKGYALSSLGKYTEAIQCYDEALKSDSNNLDILIGKGIALNKLNKHQQAIECFDKVLQKYPNNKVAQEMKGVSLKAAAVSTTESTNSRSQISSSSPFIPYTSQSLQ
jgi:tetratricopeptide (TPR) repeat protein